MNKHNSKKRVTRSKETDTRIKSPEYLGFRDKKSRQKKFYQTCRDTNRKYWTHNTEDYFVKQQAEKEKKEANSMGTPQKQLVDINDLVKGLKKKIDSNGESN